MLVFFVVSRVEFINLFECKKGGQDHIAQDKTNTQCQSP